MTVGGLEVVDTGGAGLTVVLLHGFGAPGEDLVPLASYIDATPGTRFVFPAAPLELGLPFSDARAWWMIEMSRLSRGPSFLLETPPGLAPAREKVVAMLEELGPPSRLVLGGFSQGAMLACDVALRTKIPLAGLALLSGTLVAEDEWQPLFASRRGLKIFQSHGRQDPLLPHDAAERLRALWEMAGADVRFVSFGGGHEIPMPVLEGLGAFLREVA